jgi:hypothetical protein
LVLVLWFYPLPLHQQVQVHGSEKCLRELDQTELWHPYVQWITTGPDRAVHHDHTSWYVWTHSTVTIPVPLSLRFTMSMGQWTV